MAPRSGSVERPRKGAGQRVRNKFYLWCLIGAALIAAPFVMDSESEPITNEVRKSVPGSFVKLPDGFVHYELSGLPESDLVVLVPGLTSPIYIWRELPRALLAAGFQVLRYDLFGRGFSDRPYVDYDQNLFDRQLVGLLRKLGSEAPVHLVGLSMGGPVVFEFARRHSQRVASMTLIDPAGFPVNLPPGAGLIRVPLLGDYLFRVLGERILLAETARSVFDKKLVPDLQRKFRVQLRYEGYKRAVLSTMRHMPLGEMKNTYKRVGSLQRPTLVVWGREDQIIDFENSKKIRAALRQPQFLGVPAAGHLPHYERPDLVNPVIVEFLEQAWHGEGGALGWSLDARSRFRRNSSWPARGAGGDEGNEDARGEDEID